MILEQLGTFGPQHCRALDYKQACEYTRELARTYDENFTVVSWFLPQHLRDDFRHVYAFCRCADDLGDEVGHHQRSLDLLAWWRREVDACFDNRPRHPVFVALHRTIRNHDIPRKPFDDLIDAFMQDQTVTRYDTFDQVLDYCTRSANPVGHLVLYVCGFRDEKRQQLADATCTALQLVNFWQDVRRDVIERDRIYIPMDVASRHNLNLKLMAEAIRIDEDAAPDCPACDRNQLVPSAGMNAILPAYCSTIRELADWTWAMFETGRGLWPLVSGRARLDIQLFTLGGESILRMIGRLNYNTLMVRPSLSRGGKIALMLRLLLRTLGTGGSR